MSESNLAITLGEVEKLINAGKNNEAFEQLSKVISTNNREWKVYWLLAQVSKALGDLKTVELSCKMVLNLNPEFWFARELPKHVHGYYSQFGQDEIIEQFFCEHLPRNRVFVEVGAFDGIHYSNVRRLQEVYGWTGVSIEPVGKNFEKLSKSYAGLPVTCIRCAIGEKEGIAELNVSSYPHLPDWGSDVATFSESETSKWQQKYGAVWHKEQVSVKTLNTVLRENNIQAIDFLSVDAEGHDLGVLKGLDFSIYRPKLIVVEYNKYRLEIIEFLFGKGYRLLQDNGQDLFMEMVVESEVPKIQIGSSTITTPDFFALQGLSPGLEHRDRVMKTLSCHDCDAIPKVPGAGSIVAGDSPRQLLHNGIEILYGAFHGEWMSEIIKKLKGHHEPQEEKVFYEVLKAIPPGATMIELGSFWAYYSMWFNKAIKNPRNYMIEPNPEKFELGQKHFRLNNMTGVFTQASIGQDSHQNSTFKDWDHKLYTIPQVCIDDYLDANGIKFLHLLHSDIQGAEYEMLLGCRRAISEGRIGYVFISTHGDCHDKCLTFLRDHRFTLIASHTIEESYSADGLIVAESPHVPHIPPVAISSFGRQRDGKSGCATMISEAHGKLNPHLLALGTLPFESPVKRALVDPKNLMTCSRFDIIPKFMYAEYREFVINSTWGREVYEAHLCTFNGCQEGDGSGKTGIEAFIVSFDNLLDSVKSTGFDPNRSLVPLGRNGVVIDGAHRVAACMLHDRLVETLVFDMRTNSYNYEFFQRRGLDPEYCDAIALEYCRLNPRSYIVSVFPSAIGKEQELKAALNRNGEIFYARQVQLSRQGSINLVRQMYEGEPWVGSYANQFAGAQNKAAECFRNDGPLRVYVFASDDLEKVKVVKQQIRDLFGISNHSVHINDTHDETVRLARTLLNANSLHFLNNAMLRKFPKFQAHFENYKKILREQNVDGECLCIDGSAVMAAYGIREARDLDYLHFCYDNLTFDYPSELIGSHNAEIAHHVTTRDNIIFNPRNHFYYDGVKFASLGIIRAMKQKRGEKKDLDDVALIDRLLTSGSVPPHVHAPAAKATSVERSAGAGQKAKIVGLVPARNEKKSIAQCLRALSMFTDAIVYLDDASTDETLQIVESLVLECRIERIIRKKEWLRDEPGDRNLMLKGGREIGGTHFIILDADEICSSNLAANNSLVKAIRMLKPGDRLALNWIQLWRSIDVYRFDNSVWTWNYKQIIFCDDGKCSYQSEFIHTPRVPENLTGRIYKIEGYEAGLLHFQFVNWRNLLIKQAWYRCLEHIREPNKPVQDINKRYAPSKDESGLKLSPSPVNWFNGYPFFDRKTYDQPDDWREQEILGWFEEFGKNYFSELDIWDIDWGARLGNNIRVHGNALLIDDEDLSLIHQQNRLSTAIDMSLPGGQNLYSTETIENKSARASHGMANLQQTDTAHQKVKIHLDEGRKDQAILELENLLIAQPEYETAHNDLGVLYAEEGKNENALQHYEAAVRIQPDNITFVKNLADLYYIVLKDMEKALQMYIKGLSIDPHDIEILMTLGNISVENGQIESAKDFYNRVLQIDPLNKDALKVIDLLYDQKQEIELKQVNASATGVVGQPTSYLVSAIVSTYNSERFIRGCIEDLEAQTIASRLEIVVIDSCSQQNEKVVIEKLQKNYQNIKYIRTEKRETVYAAWNRGIKAASGKYITNANTDDRHRKDAFEQMINILENDQKIALVYADVVVTEKENETFDRHTPSGHFKWYDWNRNILLEQGCFIGPQPMWRRSVHNEYGYFDDSMVTSGDYEFWLRISQTHNFHHINSQLGLYLKSPQSIEHRNRTKQLEENNNIISQYRNAARKGHIIKYGFIETLIQELKEKNIKNNKLLAKIMSRLEQTLQIELNQSKTDRKWTEQDEKILEKNIKSRNYMEVFLMLKKAVLWSDNRRYLHDLIDVSSRLILSKTSWWPQKYGILPQENDTNKKSLIPGLTSIIIHSLSNLKRLRQCIQGLKKYTPEKHEIIFVNYNSRVEIIKWLRKQTEVLPHYKLIEAKRSQSFVQVLNTGISESSGEFIVLLSSDAMVSEHWLSDMIGCLHKDESTGIVGPMAENVFGPQNVKDKNLKSMEGIKAFRERNRHRKVYTKKLEGFCLLFKHQLIKEIGLLDENFGSGNFEEGDFCLRASLAGYRNVIAGDVFIHYSDSRSFVGNRIDYHSRLSGNRKTFTQKWSEKEAVQRFGKQFLIQNAIARADEFYRKGQIEKAVASMLEAIKHAPGDRSLYFGLVEMLIDAKRYDDALGILESMSKKNADASQLALIGYCEQGLGHEAKAEEYADRALASEPSMALALNIKGVVAFNKGEKYNAEILFKKAIESAPSLGESYTNLGSLKWAAGEHAEALNLFERGFILSPTVSDVITAYHSVVVETGSFAAAEPVFLEARALHPNDKRITFFLIAILIHQGKFELAIQEIQKAMMRFGIDEGLLSAGLEIRRKIGPQETTKAGSDSAMLSLCMIVKNEEQHLAKCLMSVKAVVDEMIVVDTGSTDKTKDIATAFGAKVFDYVWTDDFSEARNYSLSKAKGIWILVLDADECLSPMDFPRLTKILKNATHKSVGYCMTTRNYTSQPSLRGWKANDRKYYGIEAGKGWIPSAKVRMFPNHKGIKFVGAVHELVEPTLKQVGIRMKDCDVPVHHYGKMESEKVITKGSEYYRLGLIKIAETNGGYRALKELAVQASELEEYDEAVKIWEKAIAVNSKDAVAYMNAGYAFFMIKQYEKAYVLSQKALELDPDLREAVLNCAGCEFMLGKVQSAIKLLEKILEKEPDYPPAMGRIAAAYIIDGKEKEGLEYMRRLQQREYSCSKIIEEQAQALFSQGRTDQAMLLREAARKINNSSRKSHGAGDDRKQITGGYHSPVEHMVSSNVPQHQVIQH